MIDRETGTREGVVWIGIGLIICILAVQFDLGSFRAPGPGFVAFLAGLFIGVVGMIMIAGKAFAKHRADQAGGPAVASAAPEQAPIAWRRLSYTLAVLLGYTLFFDLLGFIVATFLAMFALFFDWQKRNWFWSSFFSVATSLIAYLVFEVWLRCQLPRGILPWW